jgi:catechol 2,3-dioxygenase-like lactoylglutathione lyase family enzyme
MAEHATPATCGVDHVGLSVRDLEATRGFFCDCLGWHVVGERPDYPAAFVSDGQQIVTLWRVQVPDQAVAFDRRANVGLHHLALAVADRAGLDALHERVASWPGVVVEFAPELSGKGPKIHFIVREPSGIRIEFAFDPRVERPRQRGQEICLTHRATVFAIDGSTTGVDPRSMFPQRGYGAG